FASVHGNGVHHPDWRTQDGFHFRASITKLSQQTERSRAYTFIIALNFVAVLVVKPMMRHSGRSRAFADVCELWTTSLQEFPQRWHFRKQLE
ncbi:MAG TPA: hypothetical protein VKE98_14875, partial [Gemmataceae bacterium]|nr:hypothetical protein [Gemmataceae bacterium]